MNDRIIRNSEETTDTSNKSLVCPDNNIECLCIDCEYSALNGGKCRQCIECIDGNEKPRLDIYKNKAAKRFGKVVDIIGIICFIFYCVYGIEQIRNPFNELRPEEWTWHRYAYPLFVVITIIEFILVLFDFSLMANYDNCKDQFKSMITCKNCGYIFNKNELINEDVGYSKNCPVCGKPYKEEHREVIKIGDNETNNNKPAECPNGSIKCLCAGCEYNIFNGEQCRQCIECIEGNRKPRLDITETKTFDRLDTLCGVSSCIAAIGLVIIGVFGILTDPHIIVRPQDWTLWYRLVVYLCVASIIISLATGAVFKVVRTKQEICKKLFAKWKL